MKMFHKRLIIRAQQVTAALGFLAVLFAPAITIGNDKLNGGKCINDHGSTTDTVKRGAEQCS